MRLQYLPLSGGMQGCAGSGVDRIVLIMTNPLPSAASFSDTR